MCTDRPLNRIALSGATMGTRYSCVFYSPRNEGFESVQQGIHNAISEVDATLSNWKPDSAICRFNRAPVGAWFACSASMLEVLDAAIRIERASNGAFDIGIGASVAAWGFGPNRTLHNTAPEAPFPQRAVTHQALELDLPNRRVRKHASLNLDLSGIGKGYGVDRLGKTLSAHGIHDWLVGIDGEMRAKGRKPDGAPWAVGIEQPIPGKRDIGGVLELSDLAVATSGTYRHFHDVFGRRVSHTVDPATGAPIPDGFASVTVLAATGMEADAWATAVLVDGHWPPMRFPQPPCVEVIAL